MEKKKGRGRPRKNIENENESESQEKIPKKRGRKKKIPIIEEFNEENNEKECNFEKEISSKKNIYTYIIIY